MPYFQAEEEQQEKIVKYLITVLKANFRIRMSGKNNEIKNFFSSEIFLL